MAGRSSPIPAECPRCGSGRVGGTIAGPGAVTWYCANCGHGRKW